MDEHLGFLDLVLLAASILLSVLIGLYFTNKNKSMDSYMRADRGLSVVPVGLSLMTSCISGLTMFGSSAELYYQGPTYALSVIPMMIAGPATALSVLPVFYRMNELSLYKYLEKRYGIVVKYLVSTVYVLHMIFDNAVVMYLPAMALQSMFGISKFHSILFMGIICLLYSSIGGIKAVVWTDFFQGALMYASIIIVGLLGTYQAGGFANVFKLANEGHRLDFGHFFETDFTTRHTLFGMLVGSTIKHITMIGVNQIQIQRALSLSSLRQAQWSFVLCSVFTVLISLLSTYMGFIVNAAYRSCDPYLAQEIPRRDALILHYVARRLNQVPGIRGLFVAGLFSATLSTLSSSANSLAALALEDFVKPIRKRLGQTELSDVTCTRLAKLLAVIFGSLVVLMACAIDKSNSRLLQANSTMTGAIGVPFLASFVLGIFTRYTNLPGVLTGFAVVLSFGIYLTIYQTFFGESLEPAMPVYYSDQCARVFNMTMSSNLLPPVSEIFGEDNLIVIPKVKPPFSLNRISYMTLPAIQFVLTIVLASVASLATGGWNQEVDEKYLATIKHTKKTGLKGSTERGSVVVEEAAGKNCLTGFEPTIGTRKSAEK